MYSVFRHERVASETPGRADQSQTVAAGLWTIKHQVQRCFAILLPLLRKNILYKTTFSSIVKSVTPLHSLVYDRVAL